MLVRLLFLISDQDYGYSILKIPSQNIFKLTLTFLILKFLSSNFYLLILGVLFSKMEWFLQLDPVTDAYLLVSIVFLILYNSIMLFCMFAFLHACTANFQSKCRDALVKDQLNSEDLINLIKEYKLFKSGLEYILLLIFPLGQLVVIFAVYCFIISRMYWSLILAALAVFSIQYGIVHNVEIIYQQIEQIVSKGNSDAYRMMDMIKIHKMQNQVGELEKSGPVTTFGFFTVNRGIFTAMVSTTITYILILIQML